MKARSPEPAGDEEPIGPAVHTARTLPDPLQEPDGGSPDRESTIFSSPSAKIVLGHGDELPDPARTTAAAIEPSESGASAGRNGNSSVKLVGDVSQSALTAADRRPVWRESGEPVSRFTSVEEDERRRAEERSSERGPAWAQIAALAACLVVVLGLIWYLTRPLSADRLYQRIDSVAADERSERLLDAEDDINQFLTRYPDDPRAAKLKSYLDEIELLHLERRLQRLPRQLASGQVASPIERDYVEAIGLAGTALNERRRCCKRSWMSMAQCRSHPTVRPNSSN